MKIVFIEPNQGLLRVYNDRFYKYDADYFDDLNKFERQFYNQYDIIVLSHRIENKSWVDIVNDLKSNAIFIITMTFPAEYYKENEPSVYSKIKLINKTKNIFPMIKDEYEKLESFIEDKMIFHGMRQTIKKLAA